MNLLVGRTRYRAHSLSQPEFPGSTCLGIGIISYMPKKTNPSARRSLTSSSKELTVAGAPGSPKRTSRRAKIIRLLQRGRTVDEIVEKLAGSDPKKAKIVRFQISQLVANNEATQLALGAAAKGELIMALPEATAALARRASKGNVQAIKLLYEASGFWSPRTTTEHTGEIQISVKGLERPAPVHDEGTDSKVVDATVVEDN